MTHRAQGPNRRTASLFVLASCTATISACSFGDPSEKYRKKVEAAMSPQEKAWRQRFWDVNGFEFLLDAVDKANGVVVYDGDGRVTSASILSPKNRRRMGSGSKYGLPRFYRVTWREGDWQRANEPRDMDKIAEYGHGEYAGGKVVGDYTVPVADRIPDELLVEMRKRKLGLRIKLRIHPEGVLLGWDLQGPPGTGPNYGRYTMAGGDFQEADIYDGKALRMGWYIHPRTKQRIETAF